jgi:hypothetical protein
MSLAQVEVGDHGGELNDDGRSRLVAPGTASRYGQGNPLPTPFTLLASRGGSSSLPTQMAPWTALHGRRNVQSGSSPL